MPRQPTTHWQELDSSRDRFYLCAPLPSHDESMSLAPSPATDSVKIERLLAALAGVVSARVVLDDNGRIVEIHILAGHELHPKQVVRNIESALSAGFGILVDRRVISVAQLRPEVAAAQLEDPTLDPNAPAAKKRHVFIGVDTSHGAQLDASCCVTLLRDDRKLTGLGAGANTPQGRAEAAARALFDALASDEEDLRLGFEGASLFEANGKWYVLVAAHAIYGRRARLLTGVAALARSPEEAAIMAALQATNRHLSRAA
jgi:hypothetical protein